MLESYAIVAFAAFIHASFQLSVSMLTLLSGHAIGAKTAHHRVLRLTSGFLLGAAVMTMLLLAFLSLVLRNIFPSTTPALVWAIGSGLLFGLGAAVWIFYYRKDIGTTLWLPRNIARFLGERTKATKQPAEAFGLGLSSIVGELLFILAPLFVASLALLRLEPMQQLAGIGIYTAVSLLSLLIVYLLVGAGHKLSRIQRWREENKRFLQFSAGGGLLVLGFYIYVTEVVATTTMAYGGF